MILGNSKSQNALANYIDILTVTAGSLEAPFGNLFICSDGKHQVLPIWAGMAAEEVQERWVYANKQ